MQTYSYAVTVMDGKGDTHLISGTVEAQSGAFHDAAREVMRSSYEKLTGGDTLYGNPGKGKCQGPYTMTQMTLTRVP